MNNKFGMRFGVHQSLLENWFRVGDVTAIFSKNSVIFEMMSEAVQIFVHRFFVFLNHKIPKSMWLRNINVL